MRRERYKQPLLGVVLLLATQGVHAAPKNPSPGHCNAQANITNLQALSFGDVVAAAAGEVMVSTNGLRTSSGGVILAGGLVSEALFEVTSTQGCYLLGHAISLPSSATLTSATSTMTVDNFVSDISGSSLVNPTGVGQVSVGATLHVGTNQPTGAYSGQFIIDIVFQ